jgi:hypothetical protein
MNKKIRIVQYKQLTETERQKLIQLLGLKLPQELSAQIERVLDQQMLPVPELPAQVLDLCLERHTSGVSVLIEPALSLAAFMLDFEQLQHASQRCPVCEGRGRIPSRKRKRDLPSLKNMSLERLLFAMMLAATAFDDVPVD